MGQLFTIISLLNQFLPAIIATVKNVESMFPAAGSGKAKLDMVVSILNDAHTASQAAAPADGKISFDVIAPAVINIITHIVSFFNRTSWTNATPTITAPAQQSQIQAA